MRLGTLIVLLVVIGLLYAATLVIGHHQRGKKAPAADDPPPAWTRSAFGWMRRPFDRDQLRIDGRPLDAEAITLKPGQTLRLTVLPADSEHRVLTLVFPSPSPRVVHGVAPSDGAVAMAVQPESALDLPEDGEIPGELLPNLKDREHPERWPWPLTGRGAVIVIVSKMAKAVTIGVE